MIQIPQTHRDLIEGPYDVCISIIKQDGQPYSTPAWCLLEDETLLVLLAPGLKPESHIQRNTPVSLLAYDPANPLRNIEIRGHVTELESDCPSEQLEQLTRLYSGESAVELLGTQTEQSMWPSLCLRITPDRIRVEGDR